MRARRRVVLPAPLRYCSKVCAMLLGGCDAESAAAIFRLGYCLHTLQGTALTCLAAAGCAGIGYNTKTNQVWVGGWGNEYSTYRVGSMLTWNRHLSEGELKNAAEYLYDRIAGKA